jgi:hypothetical protein
VVLSRVLEFLKSPLLQGQALASVVNLFQNLLQVWTHTQLCTCIRPSPLCVCTGEVD